MSINVQNLGFTIQSTPILKEVNFSIASGQRVGLLGPNGAGKTTTLQLLAGVLTPTVGSIQLLEFDALVDHIPLSPWVGYAPEHPPLYSGFTVTQYLTFVGELYSLAPETLSNNLQNCLIQLDLEPVQHHLIGTLSKGYRQLVNLAQATLHHPKVLLLDEPTANLDPGHMIKLRSYLRSLACTLLLSSHQLSEIYRICERVLIIQNGTISHQAQVKDLDSLEDIYQTVVL